MYWWRDLRAAAADLLYWFAIPLVTRLGRTLLLVAGMGLLFGGRAPHLLPVRGLPLWQQGLAVLLAQDLLMYWVHRGFHTRRAWKVHAVHHSPAVLDWTAAARFHPVNSLLEFALADVAVLLLGFSPRALVALAPLNAAYSAMVHANLGWTFGPLRYVLASPVFHRWHHTTAAEGRDKNFAPTFPFLDLAFGTFHMPPGRRPERFGNGEPGFPGGFGGQLLYPFRKHAPAGGAGGAARRQPAVVVLTGVLAVACLAGAGVYGKAWLAARDEQRAHEEARARARQAWAEVAAQAAPATPAGDGLPAAATALALSADGRRVVLGHQGGELDVWDAATGRPVASLAGHGGRVNGVAISGDGRRVVSGGCDGAVKVWDAATGQEVVRLAGHRGLVLCVAVSGDGRCAVSGGTDGAVKVWDTATGREVASLRGETDAFPSVAVSDDGRRVVAADMGVARVWDVRTGREAFALRGHAGLVYCTAISPDGRHLVSGGSDGTAKVWDGETGREAFTLKGHTGPVLSVAVAPGGRRVISGSNDGTVKVWDLEAGREEFSLPGNAGPITGVAVSADGRRVVAGTGEGAVEAWEAGPREPAGAR
jgi:sterol desaturase/sphingolipid hydroxylase (fatty acid hydroxylase superfamily)